MTTTARLRGARAAADHLASLLSVEHGALAEFLLALSAFDEARGWAELGHASLFDFLHRRLGLSRGAAHYRGAAARLVRRHASVAEALRDGRLCLSSTAELAKVLTAENEAAVLPRFLGLSAREAREVVAELQPHPAPPMRERVTAVPQVSGSGSLVLTSELPRSATLRELGSSAGGPAAESAPATSLAPSPAPAPAPAIAPIRPADEIVPLSADLRRLHLTVSRRLLAKLEAAREARGHARPGATTEELLEEALDLLLAREEKRRTAATSKPRRAPADEPAAAEPARRHRMAAGELRGSVPAQVRREVWVRDGGRCVWPLDGGGLCGSTHRLQLDHTLAAVRGGPPTVANLRILCEAHNKEAARRTFGPRWMARYEGASRCRTG